MNCVKKSADYIPIDACQFYDKKGCTMKVCTIEKLSDFFKTQFVSTDNIPVDTARRDSICMEARASLLIEANCIGERFPAFIKSGWCDGAGWIYKLPTPIVASATVAGVARSGLFS